MQHNRFSPKLAFQLILLGGILAAALNVQYILDQYALATFHPSAEVSAIIDRLKLTPEAKGILARTRPQIDDKTTFNRDCQTSKGELELGCFVNGRIYVLKIENPSLAPEMDVVMAHELLHAAYDRLGGNQKTNLGRDIETNFTRLNNNELQIKIDAYKKTEPGQRQNELHSFLGSEFLNLSPTLEDHYNKYFYERKKIVGYHIQFEDVFERSKQAIESESAAIRALKGQLSSLNQRMGILKANGSIAAYNSLVPQYNKLVEIINSRINLNNKAVDEYNALSKSLDSQQITTPSESTVR